MNGSKKTYKYTEEVMGNLGWALTQELQPSEKISTGSKNCFIFIYQKIVVTSHKLF